MTFTFSSDFIFSMTAAAGFSSGRLSPVGPAWNAHSPFPVLNFFQFRDSRAFCSADGVRVVGGDVAGGGP